MTTSPTYSVSGQKLAACPGCGKAFESTPDGRCSVCGYEPPKFDSGVYRESLPESNLKDSIRQARDSVPESPQGVRFTLIEDLAEGLTEPAWLWRGFVARDALTVIAGRPKVGKSTLLFGLLAAIRSGAPFLDLETELSGAVLLTEERPQTIKMKARALGLDDSFQGEPLTGAPESNPAPPLAVVTRHDATGTSWPDMVEQATAYAVGHGLGLLVVDTWNSWASLAGEDENAAGAVLNAVSPLGEAAAAGLAVLLIAHQRKSGGEFGEGIRGSSALAGAVDVVVELERLRGDHRSARIVRSVSRFPTTPEELVFEFTEEGAFEPFDPEAATAAAERARVLEAVREVGPGTATDIAEAADVTIRNARRILSDLVGDGVSRSGKGVKGDPHVFEVAA